MKFIFLLNLLLLISPLYGTTGFDSFIKGDYSLAESELKKNLNREATPLDYYNLGVTSEKLKKEGQAVHSYLQALQLAPGLTEAENNLNRIVSSRKLALPKALTEQPGLGWSLPFFIFSLYLVSILTIFLLFKPGWKLKTAMIPAVILLGLSSTLLIHRYRDLNSQSFGVVTSASEMKSGPDSGLSSLGKIDEGEIVELSGVSGEWIKAKSFKGNIEGWIKGGNIKQINRNKS